MAELGGPAQDELYRNWYSWVLENLGRDPARAAAAASAATGAAAQGAGFSGSAAAARTTWSAIRPAPVLQEPTARPEVSIWYGVATVVLGLALTALAEVAGLVATAQHECGSPYPDWLALWFIGAPVALVVIGAAAFLLSGWPAVLRVRGQTGLIYLARILAGYTVALGLAAFAVNFVLVNIKGGVCLG